MKKKLTLKLKRYYNQINTIIPKDYPHRKDITSSIRQDISSYISEHPDISYADIVTHFGSPEEMALSVAETLSMEDIISASRRQRRIHIIFISIITFILCIIVASIIYFYLAIKSEIVSIEEITIVYPEIEIDEKDSVLK